MELNQRSERLYFLDAMRAILMMLGVVLHSAKVFDPAKDWLLHHTNSIVYAGALVEIIHSFRMEAFFVVSGYFCLLTLRKYELEKFLTIRLKRIIIPLVCTAVTLNTLQVFLLHSFVGYSFDLGSYINSGKYLSHLWFLVNLVFYFLFIALLFLFFRKKLKRYSAYLKMFIQTKQNFILLLLLPLPSVFILNLNNLGFPLYSKFLGVISIYELLIYLPFFIFGVALSLHQSLMVKFSTANQWLNILIVTVICFLFKQQYVEQFLSPINNHLSSAIYAYLDILRSWLLVSICFYVFYRFMNSSSKTISFLSDASYTVYLFHHCLVIAIGLLMIYFGFHPYISFLSLIILVLVSSLLLHKFLIKKNKYASFMYNGK